MKRTNFYIKNKGATGFEPVIPQYVCFQDKCLKPAQPYPQKIKYRKFMIFNKLNYLKIIKEITEIKQTPCKRPLNRYSMWDDEISLAIVYIMSE